MTKARDIADLNVTILDSVESGATADQSNAEIRAAVEAATDSNVFTDADHSKLNAIEAGADVTDTANVTAMRFYPTGSTAVVAVEDVVNVLIKLMKSDILNERFILVASGVVPNGRTLLKVSYVLQ